jgi:FlaA1/EpsC-like NDP-sugar epimerase
LSKKWDKAVVIGRWEKFKEFLLKGKENNLRQRFSMRPIDEQTVLITGATSGLGRELARSLVKRGATLLLHGRDLKLGLETVGEL